MGGGEGAGGEGGDWVWGAGDALGVEYVQKPPDGRADACCSLLIAPSYITYVPAVVASVQGFFATRRTLELATLQVRGGTGLGGVRWAWAQLCFLPVRAAGTWGLRAAEQLGRGGLLPHWLLVF